MSKSAESQNHQESISRSLLSRWLHKAVHQFKRISPSESREYKAWRNDFFWKRVGTCLKVAIPCLLTYTVFDWQEVIRHSNEFSEISLHLKRIFLTADICRVGILLIGLAFYNAKCGYCRPAWLFLYLSWSCTLLQPVLGSLQGFAIADPVAWSLIFLMQATFVPVRWQVHFLSHVGTLIFFFGINPIFGITTTYCGVIREAPLFAIGSMFDWIWFCFICSLAVYLYERLQRKEFEARQELQVFYNSLSHDLRTPVMGAALVLKGLIKESEDEVTVSTSILERLLQGCDRQMRLINSMFEGQNKKESKQILNRQPYQLTTLIQSTLEDIKPALIRNRIELLNKVRHDLPLVDIDPIEVWRVFSNLIDNVLKHNPPGTRLTIGTIVEGNFIRCFVMDNGVGINQKQAQNLFERYARGENTQYRPGLGLGLYTCKRIVYAHSGEIGLTSFLGKGSTFWLTLPLYQEKLEAE